MLPDLYYNSFDEIIDLRKFDLNKHRTAGLCLRHSDNCLFLGGMTPGTPGAKIPRWHSRIKGAWLIKVWDANVTSIEDAQLAFAQESTHNPDHTVLLSSHPEIHPDISYDGLPIMSSAPFSQHIHDQLNKRWDFSTVADYLRKASPYDVVADGNVLNYTTKVMKLTRGKLTQQKDWNDWQSSKYLQLNQYEDQGMFGTPVPVTPNDAVFHLVWTYYIKAVDGRNKARCVCDGSTRSGKVQILPETYANCVNQTSARMFYAIVATENLLSSKARTSSMPSPKHLLQKKDSSFYLTVRSMNGGHSTRINPPLNRVTSFPSFLRCKATPNLCDSGRNMLILFYEKSALPQQSMSHASTWGRLTTSVSFSCDRLMILRLRRRTSELQRSLWTLLMTSSTFQ